MSWFSDNIGNPVTSAISSVNPLAQVGFDVVGGVLSAVGLGGLWDTTSDKQGQAARQFYGQIAAQQASALQRIQDRMMSDQKEQADLFSRNALRDQQRRDQKAAKAAVGAAAAGQINTVEKAKQSVAQPAAFMLDPGKTPDLSMGLR